MQNLATENKRLAEEVDRAVDESARRTETRLEVEARVESVVGRMEERVEVLERENEGLRERVDGMGREVGEIVGDVKMEVLGAIRWMMGRLERNGLTGENIGISSILCCLAVWVRCFLLTGI